MSNWMRRRIERSRARCAKVSADQRPDKARPQNTPPQPSQPAQASQGDES